MVALAGLVRVASLQLAAASLAFVIYHAGGEPGPGAFAAVLCASTLSTWSIFFLLELNRDAHHSAEARESLFDYLYRVLYRKARSGSYLKAVDGAREGVENEPLKQKISEAGRRFFMGAGPVSAADRVDESVIAGGERMVHDALRKRRMQADSGQAEMEGAAQRYATLNMFVATILPSFLVFAFIGDTILSQGSFGLLLFASVLLLLVPLIYSIGNAFMWRRLLG